MGRAGLAGHGWRGLGAVLLAGVALAGPARGQVDRDAEACAGKESTIGIEDCYAALTARWDKALNAAYGAAMKAADPAGTGALRAAERAWIEFRKQECLYRGAGPGTIGRVVAANCFYAVTRARAEQLEEDARGLGPG